MRSDLHRSAAIVTGGAQGIGRGIVVELARAEAAVLVADLHPEAAEPVVEEVLAMGGRGAAVSVEHCVSEAIRRFGRIDILAKANGGGKIINIASTGGRLGVGFAPAYFAFKAGVINLTQSLAHALGSANTNVNTICPGAVSTVMQDNIKTLRACRRVLRFGSGEKHYRPGAQCRLRLGHELRLVCSVVYTRPLD